MLFLTIINLVLIGYLVYEKRESSKERKSLINAIIAKNSQELESLELVDKMPQEEEPEAEPDLVTTDTLTTEEWTKMITERK